MPDYRKMFDQSNFLYAFDLDGRDVVVTVERVEAGEVTGAQGKISKKPVATFAGKAKKLALNRTNCKTLLALAGSKNTDDWAGLSVTLYPTTTTMGGDTVDCIRIRPVLAKSDKAAA